MRICLIDASLKSTQRIKRRVRAFTAFALAWLVGWSSSSVSAQTVGSGPLPGTPAHRPAQSLNLDLSSQTAAVKIGASVLPQGVSATVNVGGNATVFHTGDLVTVAEYAAVLQVINSGKQGLLLDGSGRATGGSLLINSLFENNSTTRFLSGLTVPSGVTLVQDAGVRNQLNVSGDITNSGRLLFATSQALPVTATVSGANIYNQPGALLGTIGQPGAVPCINAVSMPIDLFVQAASSIVNGGTISSSGALNITAASLVNTGIISSASTTAVSVSQLQNLAGASMTAGQSLNISTSSLVNSGLISATNALFVQGLDGKGLNINNGSGALTALTGALSISTSCELNLTGGFLSGKTVHLSSSRQNVSASAERIEGPVYVMGNCAEVSVSDGNLQFAELNVAGDPLLVNSASDLILPATLTTGGAPITALAAGSVLGDPVNGTTIDTSSATFGGNVVIVAGAAIGSSNGYTTVAGPSGSNGSVSGIKSINTSGNPSGDVTIGAFGGSIDIGGNITARGNNTSSLIPANLLPPGSSSAKGLVRLYAPNNISVGDISSNGISPATQQIDIVTANPLLPQTMFFNGAGALVTGLVRAGSQTGPGSITTGNLNTGYYDSSGSAAGSINMLAGGSVTTATIRTLGGGGHLASYWGGGYDYGTPGGNSGNLSISALAGAVTVNGDINTAGGAGGGSNHWVGGQGGAGGNVSLSAQGNITVNGPIVTVGGGGGGGSGICSCDTAGGGGSLGNSAGPSSGGLFQTWPPYNGIGYLDAGPVYGNPNHPPFPAAGEGGSNSAYDVGCCGGGRGGNAGQGGYHGGTGTFQRGYWDDVSPAGGGAAGVSGNVSLSGRDISITKTLASFYGNQGYVNSSPFANYSIYTYSQSGGGSVTVTSSGVRTTSSAYSADSNLMSGAPSVSAQMRAGQLIVSGLVSANSILFNNVSQGGGLAAGAYQLPLNGPASMTILENNLPRIISIGQLVTPAEWIALVQVGDFQNQTIGLGPSGTAVGGSFTIAAQNLPTGGFSSLSIPQDVSVTVSTNTLSVTGLLTLNGNMGFTTSGALTAGGLSLGSNANLFVTAPTAILSIYTSTVSLGSGSSLAAGKGLNLLASTGASLTVNLPDGMATLATQTGSVMLDSGNQALSLVNIPGAVSRLLVNGSLAIHTRHASVTIGQDVTLDVKNTAGIQIDSGQLKNYGTMQSAMSDGSAGALNISCQGDLEIISAGGLSVSGTNGDGGKLDLSVSGLLSMPGTVLDAGATGAGSSKGGSINISAAALSLIGSSPLILRAAATGNGAGGSIKVAVTNAAASLALGSQAIRTYASGGPFGGSGGSVWIAAGGDLTVDPAFLNAGPLASGSGAIIHLTAGQSGSGRLLVTGALDASGQGAFKGGELVLESNSADTFFIGVNGSNAIVGPVTANAGQTGGDAGAISIVNYGPGGVTLPAAANISAATGSAGGKGGTLSLSAPSGVLVVPSGTYNFDGSGANGSGGKIILAARQLSVFSSGSAGPANIILSASGSGTGSGGTVSVSVTGAGEDLSTGTGDNELTIYATGGSSGAGPGDGGGIYLMAGRNLTLDPALARAMPQGADGRGATISLQAGVAGAGVVNVKGNLDASGIGQGAGGKVSLAMNSDSLFAVGAAGPACGGICGIAARAGTSGGDGGYVALSNAGVGGVTIASFSSIALDPSPTGGAGGTLIVEATGGTLTIPTGNYSASAVPGSAGGNGGQIAFRGMTLALSDSNGLFLSANASGMGNGGRITLESSSANSSVSIGSGKFALSATGGSTHSGSGAGGILTVSSGGNVAVDVNYLNAGPAGDNGIGAQIFLSAAGNLYVSGNLSANGRGTGSGGKITLSANSVSPFTINGGQTANGVNGSLSARSGTIAGDGGFLSVTNFGSGGITLQTPSSLSVTALSGGGGGIAMQTAGIISMGAGVLSADAQGLNAAAGGGSIQITANALQLTGNAALVLSANATSPSGSGGRISITLLGAVADLLVSNNAGAVTLSATGGTTQGSSTGSGGLVNLSAGRNITVNSGALSIQPLGAAGNGASLAMLAGQAGGGDLIVNTAIDLSGAGGGGGGNLDLRAQGRIQVNGNILTSGGDLSASGTAGSAGSMHISAKSSIYITGSLLAFGGTNSGTGAAGNGGAIDLSTANDNVLGYFSCPVDIGGIIDIHGGNATGGGAGGISGSLIVHAGTFQVRGMQSNMSINAAAMSTALASANGHVSIYTYGLQPVPLDFDLTTTWRNDYALPGGLFSVGDSSVNGTAAPIVGVAGVATSSNAGAITDRGGGQFVNGNITIRATGSTANIDESGQNVFISSDNGNGVRTKVTPGQALALYQVSRGQGQTVRLSKPDAGGNGGGQVLDGSEVNINQGDIYGAFSQFNMRTANSAANVLTVNIIGMAPSLNLGLSNSANIGGSLNFTSGGALARLDLGNTSLNIDGTGNLNALSVSQLTIHASNGNLNVSGSLRGSNILIDVPGGYLSLSMSAQGLLGGPAGGQGMVTVNADNVNINGGQFVNGVLQIGVPGATSIPNNINLLTSFKQGGFLGTSSGRQFHISVPVSLMIADAAILFSPGNITIDGSGILTGGNAIGGVKIQAANGLAVNVTQFVLTGTNSSLLSDNGSISISVPNGVSLGSNPIINASGNISVNVSNGLLTAGANAQMSAGGSLSLQTNGSNGGITFGAGAILSAGRLNAGAPNAGALSGNNVLQPGGLNMQANGGVGVAIGSGAKLIATGGDLQITSTTAAAPLAFGDDSQLTANGGNISLQAQNQLNFGINDLLYARTNNGGGGNINLQAQGGIGAGSAAQFNAMGSVQLNAQSGSVNLSGPQGVSVIAAQSLNISSSSLITNAGAIISAGQTLQISANNGLNLAAGTRLISGQGMSLQTQKDLIIGDNSSLTNAASTLQINVNGQNSSLSIGYKVAFSSGTLNGNPGFAPLQQSNIAKSGSINIQAQNATLLFAGAGQDSFVSNGGDMQLSAYVPAGGLAVTNASSFVSNGGNLNFNFSGPGALDFSTTSTVSASSLNGGSGSLNIAAQGALSFGAGSSLTALGSAQISLSGKFTFNGTGISSGAGLNIQGQGISVGAGATLSGGTGLQISAGSGNTAFSLGAGSQLLAGVLNGSPGFVPLSQSSVSKGGSLNISAQGAQGLVFLGPATLVASGGSLQVNATVPSTGLVVPAGSSIIANGGNVNFSLQASVPLSVSSSIDAVIQASTLNGGSGSITLSSPNGLTFGPGTVIQGLGQVQLGASSGGINFGGSLLSAGTNLNIQGTGGVSIAAVSAISSGNSLQINASGNGALLINAGAKLTAGELNGVLPFGALTQTSLLKAGSMSLNAQGTGGLILSGSGSTSLSTNGGDLQINAYLPSGGMTIADNTSITANGGNININFNGPGQVTAGTAVKLRASTMGGGGGNLQFAAPNAVTFGSGAVITGLGAVQSNISGGLFTFAGIMSAGTNLTVNGQAGLSIGASSVLTSANGSVQMNSQGSFTVGAGATVSSAGSLQMSGQNSFSVGDGATVTSTGSLQMSGQNGLMVGAGATITSANGSLQMNSQGVLTVGATATVSSAGSLQMSGQNGLTVGAGATVTTVNGSVQMNGQAGLTIGAGAVVTGATGLQLVSGGQNAALIIGAGARLSAGLLNGNPAFGPMSQTNIAKSGSLDLSALGSQGLVLQGPATMTSNGGNLQLSIAVPLTGLAVPTGSSFTANGGNVNISLQASASISVSSSWDDSIQASTLNGGGGGINLNSPNGLSFGPGAVINGLGQVQLGTSNGGISFAGSLLNAGTNLTIQGNGGVSIGSASTVSSGNSMQLTSNGTGAVLMINAGAKLTAGALNAVMPFGAMTQGNLLQSGSISINAQGSGGFIISGIGATSFTTNGGDFQLNAYVPVGGLNLGDNTSITANGSSLSFNLNGAGQVSTGANVKLMASTINGSSGNLQINAPSSFSFGIGSAVNALGSVQINLGGNGSAFNYFGTSLSAGSSMNIQSAGGINFGSGSIISAGNNLQITANGTGASVTVNAGSKISAGVLNGSPQFGPLTQANIVRPGSLTINAQGTGGLILPGGSVTTLTANGGDLQISAYVPSSGMTIADGTTFAANGGSVNFNLNGSGQLSAGAGVRIMASTVNGSAGNIQFNSPNAVTFSSGSVFSGLGQVQLNVYGGPFTFTGNLAAGNNLTINGQSGLVLGPASTASSGAGLNISGQLGVAIGAGSTLTSTGSMQMNGQGGLTIGAGSTLTSTGSMQITGQGGLKIGAGSALSGASGLQVTANGTNVVFTLGANVQLTAGLLNGHPAFGPLTQSSILQSGSLDLSAQGGQGLVIEGPVSFVANGGNLQIATVVPAAGLLIPAGTRFVANGGNLSIWLSAQGQIAAPSNVDAVFMASTVNGGNGNININSPNGMLFGAGSSIAGLGQVQLNVNGVLSFGGTSLSAGSNFNVQSQSTLSLGLGQQLAITAGGAIQLNANSGSVNLGKEVNLSSQSGAVSIQSPGDLSTGTNSSITAATGITLTANGATAKVSIGGFLQAGAFVNPGLSNGPLTSPMIKSSGTISINDNGAGGIFFKPAAPASIASIGGNITLSANNSGSPVYVGDGGADASIVANGGALQIAASGGVTLGVGANLKASTLNNWQGNININAGQTVTQLSGANASAMGTLNMTGNALNLSGILSAGATANLTTNGSLSIGNGAVITSGNTLALSNSSNTALSLGAGSHLSAGQLLNDSGSGVVNLQTVAIVKAGAVAITNNGSGGIFIDQGVQISSNAGDLTISTSGPIILDSQPGSVSNTTILQANGGNVLVMSQQRITQLSSASAGNTFVARSIGTSSNNTNGGGIQISSGTTSAQVQNDLFRQSGSQPSLSALQGINATTVNDNGAIVLNVQGTASLNLGNASNPSILTLSRGAIRLDSTDNNAAVLLNQSTFQTYGFRPISYLTPVAPRSGNAAVFEQSGGKRSLPRILFEPGSRYTIADRGIVALANGCFFVAAPESLTITAGPALIKAEKNSMLQFECDYDLVVVRACSGVRDVIVKVSDRRVYLAAGQELLISAANNKIEAMADGIGRRQSITTITQSGYFLCTSDFSIVSMVANSNLLSNLRKSEHVADRRLFNRLIRMAAVVDVVTKGKGAYKAMFDFSSTQRKERYWTGSDNKAAFGFTPPDSE